MIFQLNLFQIISIFNLIFLVSQYFEKKSKISLGQQHNASRTKLKDRLRQIILERDVSFVDFKLIPEYDSKM